MVSLTLAVSCLVVLAAVAQAKPKHGQHAANLLTGAKNNGGGHGGHKKNNNGGGHGGNKPQSNGFWSGGNQPQPNEDMSIQIIDPLGPTSGHKPQQFGGFADFCFDPTNFTSHFIDDEETKAKIAAAWAGYQPGDNCTEEKKAMKAVFIDMGIKKINNAAANLTTPEAKNIVNILVQLLEAFKTLPDAAKDELEAMKRDVMGSFMGGDHKGFGGSDHGSFGGPGNFGGHGGSFGGNNGGFAGGHFPPPPPPQVLPGPPPQGGNNGVPPADSNAAVHIMPVSNNQ
uniref:SXP/RAL-2 family protein Ani s 5-like cation-binding domain-containing protein n=1 Tax=Plectus sambesii TaxID=2011161 RepID=A0A914WFF3_9BILA